MRKQLENGINLTVIENSQFKTNRIVINFVAPLAGEESAERMLLANLLEISSAKYPSQQRLAEKLSELYGASFGITVSKKGNYHLISLILNGVNDKFLEHKTDSLKEIFNFIKEIIFNPNVTDGHFDEETFKRQKENLMMSIRSISDDKQSYAGLELQKLYFQNDQAIPSYGTIEDIEKITATSLFEYYKQMLATNRVDIFVIGELDEIETESIVKILPFTPRDFEMVPIFYHQDVKEVVTKVETQAVAQGKLNMAYQLPVYYRESGYYAGLIFNGVFGGSPLAKLFVNVREKASLAYYASSSLDTFRGILTVQTGIESQNKDKVIEIVQQQLDDIIAGDISDELLNKTKMTMINQYQSSLDSQMALINQSMVDQLTQTEVGTTEWIDGINAVDKSAVQAIAREVKLQAIFFLNGEIK